MNKHFFILIFLHMAFNFNPVNAQNIPAGIFEQFNSIGNPKLKGSIGYISGNQEYIISASGKNMWFTADQFSFLWKKIKGDFIVTARAEFQGEGKELHRKFGWMVRNSLDSNAVHLNISVHGDGLTAIQYRPETGSNTEEVRLNANLPDIIQIERKGKTFIISIAKFGETFVSETFNADFIGDEPYVGLFVCSHNESTTETVKFSNVRIVIPAGDDLVPYKQYLGSHLEIMDVATGNRTIRYTVENSLQAPNWTVDGKSLIYNRDGILYSFDIKTGKPKVLNTGFAKSNNNDHVLSFDGKMLGISHHAKEDDSKSIIYVLPSSGGEPKRVTKTGPSYLHGWSPDKKNLVFTGERNGVYDIYSVDIATGEETRLTDAEGLDDGSEYTPDGKYIYFNSNRTGTMQIWRMKPDGTNQEQITFGELNDWFPHVSPDMKWIVFLSFPKEVPSGDHPFYKRVYLRMIPFEGGEPKVIAYLYGGQGTVNVPSWSPDSKRIAFVSNSYVEKKK
ncbi:MAG: hypothetical protein U0W24_19060 [Bacteroidales bacterium]